MEIFFIGLVIWVFASYIIADLLPMLIELSVYIVRFLFLCVWETAKFLGMVIGTLLAGSYRCAAALCRHAFRFLAILIDEWRRGPQAEYEWAEEQAFDDFAEYEDETFDEFAAGDDSAFEDFAEDEVEVAPEPGPYEQALALFGLLEPFTQADLKRVYRAAMKRAHTDAGGTLEEAQAFNAARDLINQAKGWG